MAIKYESWTSKDFLLKWCCLSDESCQANLILYADYIDGKRYRMCTYNNISYWERQHSSEGVFNKIILKWLIEGYQDAAIRSNKYFKYRKSVYW